MLPFVILFLVFAAIIPPTVFVVFLTKTVLARQPEARAKVVRLAALRIGLGPLGGLGGVGLAALGSRGPLPVSLAVLAFVVGWLAVAPLRERLRKRVHEVVAQATANELARTFQGAQGIPGRELPDDRDVIDVEARVVREDPPSSPKS